MEVLVEGGEILIVTALVAALIVGGTALILFALKHLVYGLAGTIILRFIGSKVKNRFMRKASV